MTIEPVAMGTAEVAAGLLTPEAVRTRARTIYNAGLGGELAHFIVHADRLDAAADYVAKTIAERYPSLQVPFHARWRHFVFNGEDRWAELARTQGLSGDELARAAFDLAVTSVLLDAGAGAAWRYRDHDGSEYRRSEGLALASLEMFARGLFSSSAGDPLRADAEALAGLSTKRLAQGFQADADNQLTGLEGRAELLRQLGRAAAGNRIYFPGTPPRLGDLFDVLKADAPGGTIPARRILIAVLNALAPIWPGREMLGGVPLGDTWRHPFARARDASDGLVPFHKLSQWLTYSLIEPLQAAGLTVADIDALTGLAEYRNGGLFVDTGVLELRDKNAADRAHAPGSELVVEWRALTVALLDEIAPLVRERLDVGAFEMPLASILEGGTWAAGRKIAAEKRPGGPPPLRLDADGTVF